MKPSPRALGAVLAVVVVVGGGAWLLRGHIGRDPAPAAHLSVEWRGTYAGAFVLPATLHWCPVTRVGVLEAISGDTGVMVVLYERDSLVAGVHPVIDAAANAAPQRPGASAAMRWMHFANDTSLAMFRSVSGSLQLRLGGGKASGEFTAPMRGYAGLDSVMARAVFRDVPVTTTAAGCT